ncbi:hypothetical protein ACJ2A9_22115 [Anaerobacillus sp. MEB173]|uniref:hypothetical protein n=1 Tax=Anaerobacillus sp. MEB173 TaxID=3383345 RepID=UPI003F9294D0
MQHDSMNANEEMLINEIKKIEVTKPEETGMLIQNPTDLSIIKEEEKFIIVAINKKRCAIYFEKEEKAELEFEALKIGAKRGITPKALARKGNYVIMKTIKAPTVAEYLDENTITKELTEKLLHLLDEFKAAGFTRLDQNPSYIYLLPTGNLKTIHVYRNTKLPIKEFPRRLIKGMGHQVTDFLKYVEELNPDLYETWRQHPKFESTVEKAKSGDSN